MKISFNFLFTYWSVIDFKTSTKEKKEEWVENYFIQGAAYCEMYEERFDQPIDRVVILIVTEDGAVQTFSKRKPRLFKQIAIFFKFRKVELNLLKCRKVKANYHKRLPDDKL